MTDAIRGPIGSYVGSARLVPEPPRVRRAPEVDKPTDVSSGQSWSYVTSRGRYHMVKIVARADDRDHVAVANAILGYREHYKGVIEFENYRFQTTRPLVAAYLDDAIRRGLRGVSRDSAEILIRCAVCDNLYPNTKAGQANLADHMMNDHPPLDMPEIPLSVGGHLNPGQPNTRVNAQMIAEHEAEAAERSRDVTLDDDLREFLGEDGSDELSAEQVAAFVESPPTEQPAKEPSDFHFAGQPLDVSPETPVEAEDDGNAVPQRQRGRRNNGRSG